MVCGPAPPVGEPREFSGKQATPRAPPLRVINSGQWAVHDRRPEVFNCKGLRFSRCWLFDQSPAPSAPSRSLQVETHVPGPTGSRQTQPATRYIPRCPAIGSRSRGRNRTSNVSRFRAGRVCLIPLLWNKLRLLPPPMVAALSGHLAMAITTTYYTLRDLGSQPRQASLLLD